MMLFSTLDTASMDKEKEIDLLPLSDGVYTVYDVKQIPTASVPLD